MAGKAPEVDVMVRSEGSVVAFDLLTDSAKAWVKENVQSECWQWMGDATLVVEHGYAANLAQGLQDAGLVVY